MQDKGSRRCVVFTWSDHVCETKVGNKQLNTLIKAVRSYQLFIYTLLLGSHILPFLIQQEDWMVKLDLKDAYLQVVIHPDQLAKEDLPVQMFSLWAFSSTSSVYQAAETSTVCGKTLAEEKLANLVNRELFTSLIFRYTPKMYLAYALTLAYSPNLSWPIATFYSYQYNWFTKISPHQNFPMYGSRFF